jgi:uncharacterized membrane-anchored protein YhcB (DUF1043 family)
MYHLTLMWLAITGAAFIAGVLCGRLIARRSNQAIARFEALAHTLETQPRDWPPIPRVELAAVIRSRLRGGQ